MIATVDATPNIALVKYWGKRDEILFLPMEGSISVTMDKTLTTRTTVMFSKNFQHDEVFIDNIKIEGRELETIIKHMDLIRNISETNLKFKMVSINGFPTAAGLASSASGLAALTCASARALRMKLNTRELSILARQGSGSACRSVYGGFVEWKRGAKNDGSDSYAIQIASHEHWPEIRNVVAIVEQRKKRISSREGMEQTVATSILYPRRIDILKKTISTVRKAILEKNLHSLLETIMRESNDLHAVMLDTWPPLMYLNDTSKEIIYAIHEFNADKIKAGYTFDAGPNANIFTAEKYVHEIEDIIKRIYGVKRTLVCKVGRGPKYIESFDEHLIDPETGDVRMHRYDEKSNKIIVKALN